MTIQPGAYHSPLAEAVLFHARTFVPSPDLIEAAEIDPYLFTLALHEHVYRCIEATSKDLGFALVPSWVQRDLNRAWDEVGPIAEKHLRTILINKYEVDYL